jgi:hypothetical protein
VAVAVEELHSVAEGAGRRRTRLDGRVNGSLLGAAVGVVIANSSGVLEAEGLVVVGFDLRQGWGGGAGPRGGQELTDEGPEGALEDASCGPAVPGL